VRPFNVLIERRTNATSTHFITGHCFLNSYQHRFSLSPSASCLCGAPSETIPHFIIHCPIFSSLRSILVDVVSSSGHPWPPPLHIFPQCNFLWSALAVFVSRTKRLTRKKRECWTPTMSFSYRPPAFLSFYLSGLLWFGPTDSCHL
jgi:hypothetical protein